MIKNYEPKNYDGANRLPVYVSNVRVHVLIGIITGGYMITLAKLSVGESVSAGNRLSHAMFESFTDHGERKKIVRTRASGYDSDFIAMKNAMIEAGIEFEPFLSCPPDVVLRALGTWFMAYNPEIESFTLMSQTCH